MDNREKLLEQLTGVDSSKLNYYVELKKRNQEVLKQNSRLEVLHQLARDMNIDMSIQEILDRTFSKLPAALSCDFLGLVTLRGDELRLKSMVPENFCQIERFPADSPSARVIREKKAAIFDASTSYNSHMWHNNAFPSRLVSLAIAPMFERSQVIGVLVVGKTDPTPTSEAELNFVQHLADLLSISTHNSRLYNRVSRAKSEWEATFNAVTDAVFLIDTDYNVLLHNNRLPPNIDKLWHQALSNKCFDRLHGQSRPCKTCPIEELKRSGKPAFLSWRTDEGLLLQTSYYPVFNEEGQLSAVTIILKDVTEKTRMEAKLVQSAKLAAIGEMAAGVAHELNSPLTVIIGTAQMLIRELADKDRPQEGEELEDIINSGIRCKRIIQNLLTFSRQDQIPLSDTDLNEEVDRVLSLIKYQINRNQIQIRKNLCADLPKLRANGPQIQQVLTNLLVNARDAIIERAPQEKIIEVSSSLRSKGNKCFAVLSVKDNGAGIAPESLSKIFTPFFTSKEATRGTGLGLSVSLGIIESHNGTIEVDSVPGKGSTFSLVLPVPLQD